MSKESFFLSSPTVTDMRTFFQVKWAIRLVNGGPKGMSLQIDWPKMAKKYPFLEGANFCKPAKSVNQKTIKKKKLSPVEQAKLYRKLLNSGKVKTELR